MRGLGAGDPAYYNPEGLLAQGSQTRGPVLTATAATIAAVAGGAAFGGWKGALLWGSLGLGVSNLLLTLSYVKDAQDSARCEQNPECTSAPGLHGSQYLTRYAWGAGLLGLASLSFGIYRWRKG